MKKNRQLEKEIRQLIRTKKRGDLLFLYGVWIAAGLFILGLLLRFIMVIKFGFYQNTCSGVSEVAKIPEMGMYYLK